MRDGQQPESSYPFDPGRQNEPPTYGIAQDPTVGEQFNLRRTMRISSVLYYNAEVLADNGHNGADERLTISIDSESWFATLGWSSFAHPRSTVLSYLHALMERAACCQLAAHPAVLD